MNKNSTSQAYKIIGMILVFAASFLAACDSSQQGRTSQGPPMLSAPTPLSDIGSNLDVPDIPAVEQVRAAVAQMNRATSLHFEMRDNLPELRVFPAEGSFVGPDKARGIIYSSESGTVDWIKWGPTYFLRDPNTGNYRLGGTETPSGVFLKFELLEDILPHIDSATIASDEEVAGVDTTHIVVIYNMKALPTLAAMSPDGKGRFDAWIGKETRYIYKLGFSAWNTDTPLAFNYYSNFNEPISPPIEAPKLDFSDTSSRRSPPPTP